MNLIGVLLCGVWAMIVGYFWYSPMLFAKQWMKLAGITQKDMKMSQSDMGKMYGGTLLLNLLMALILGTFFLGPENTLGLNVVLVLVWWFIFTFIPAHITNTFNRKPLKLTIINTGYQLVSFLGFAVILSYL